MPRDRTLPDVGALIRPLLESVPMAARPRVIAQLERAAADRYDGWAASCRDAAQADGLRACARRERDIADHVEALFPARADADRHCAAVLPRIATAYAAAMADRPVSEQYAMQAAAERSGAAFWRDVAAAVPDASGRDALTRCAELEEESAAFLEAVLSSGA